ncbi:hypothetical protein HDU93_001747 [Gonapodya sp. JEL0774]|nr:hypothetical protein HDU93_001747 [Gonapodya sp. JEL0774]
MADFNPDDFSESTSRGTQQPGQQKQLSTAAKVGLGLAGALAAGGLATGIGLAVKHHKDGERREEEQLHAAQAQAAQAQQQAAQYQQQAAQAQAQLDAAKAQELNARLHAAQAQDAAAHYQAPSYAAPQAAGGAQYHTIVAGNTYWQLSQQYGTTVQALEQLNPGVN